MSHSVNLALQRLIDARLPISVSVMFPCPWYQETVEILKRHPEVAVGIHLTLNSRSEEHTSELQSPCNLVCRLLLEKKKKCKLKRLQDLPTVVLARRTIAHIGSVRSALIGTKRRSVAV